MKVACASATIVKGKGGSVAQSAFRRFGIGVFSVLACAWLPAVAQERNLNIEPAAVQSGGRVALVIGNAAYKDSPLANPVNDAVDFANALEQAGFSVILRRDVDTRGMRQAIREFGDRLRRAEVGLFYFAGHGMQVRGANYLIPVAADIHNEADVEDLAIDAGYVLRTMEESRVKVSIAILDACRNNPFARGMRSSARGLAQMTAATGSLIAFATAPGSVAADGSGRNGVYTKHLLANMAHGDSDILKVFQRTRAAVLSETGGRQTPWESTSLVGEFHFHQGRAPVAAASQIQTAAIAQVVAPHRSLNIGYVDAGRISGSGDAHAKLQRAEHAIRVLAAAYPLGLVLQEAVYVAPRHDITDGVIAYLKSQSIRPHAMPAADTPLRVAVVSTSRILKEAVERGETQENLVARSNIAIRQLAERYGIDLVVQQVAFGEQTIDVTDQVIRLMKGRAPDAARMERLPNIGPRTVAISSERILRDARIARAGQQRIEAEFRARDEELARLNKQGQSATREFDRKLTAFREDLNRRRKEEVAIVVAAANRVINSYAETHGIGFVLQEPLYAAPGIDVTDRIIQELDRP